MGGEVAVEAHLPEHGFRLLQVKASGCKKSMVTVGYQTICLQDSCGFPQPTVSFGSGSSHHRGLIKQHSPEFVE